MRNLIMLSLFLASSFSHAQSVVPPNIRANNTIERLNDLDGLSNADMLYGIPFPEGKVIGDAYLDTHWKNAIVLLYEKEKLIEGYPMRYDIQLDELEFKAKNGIKVLKGTKIKSFVWTDSLTKEPAYFVNAKDFPNEDGVKYTGFFQVLTDGSLPLFKKTFITLKKADYNVQFNVGSHDDKIIKKDEFFILKDSQMIEMASAKKKFLPLFGDKADAVEKFMKDNDLTASKEDDLKMIFEHYNRSLVNN